MIIFFFSIKRVSRSIKKMVLKLIIIVYQVIFRVLLSLENVRKRFKMPAAISKVMSSLACVAKTPKSCDLQLHWGKKKLN